MPNEVEVERMVARLVGDTVQMQQSYREAAAVAAEASRIIEESSEKAKERSITDNILMASAMQMIGGKLKQLGSDALGGYAEAELGELKLKTVLESNGRQVEATMKSYQDYAAQIQKNTTLEDDYIITLFRSAEQFEVTGAAAKSAVKDAISLAAASDVSAEAAMRVSAAMAKGDVAKAMQFSRSIKELRGVRDEATFLTKYANLIKSGFAQAEAETKTFSGSMKQMKVAFGNALEIIGKTVAEGIQPFVKWIKEASDWFQTLNPEIASVIAKVGLVTVAVVGLMAAWGPLMLLVGGMAAGASVIFGPIGIAIATVASGVYLLVQHLGGLEATWGMVKTAAMELWNYLNPIAIVWWNVTKSVFTAFWNTVKTVFTQVGEKISSIWTDNLRVLRQWADFIKGFVIEEIIMIGFQLTHMGDIMKLVWTLAKLNIVEFANEVQYQFTTVMPAWIKWFGQTVGFIFERMFTNAKNTFKALGDNLGVLFTTLPDLMRGKISFREWIGVWKPLEKSLETVFIGLPTIAARQMGPLEKSLRSEASRIRATLNSEFAEFRNGILSSIGEAVADPLKEVKDPAAEAAAAIKHVGKAAHDASNEAAEFGSAEHLARLSKYFDMLQADPDIKKIPQVSDIPVIASTHLNDKNQSIPVQRGMAQANPEFVPDARSIAIMSGKPDPNLVDIKNGINKLVQQGAKPKTEVSLAGAGL